MRRFPTVLLAALTLVLAAPLAAQQGGRDEAQQEGFGEQIEVREVLLDVLVTDKQGNVVVGLGPEDFVVEEDGTPVDVEDVTFYSSSELLDSPEALKARGVEVDTVPEDRYFILLIDDLKRYQGGGVDLVGRQLAAARDAKRWVREDLAPADWVAVLGYGYKLEPYQDFTHDRAALERAIDRAARGADAGAQWESRRTAAAEGVPTLFDDLPTGKELRKATTRVFDALELIAGAAGGVRGRKNLVWFTIGAEGFATSTTNADQRYYPDMVEALNDNNVAVYPVEMTPANAASPFEAGLNDLASQTGGEYYFRFASFGGPLDQVAAENTGYYLLAYRATGDAAEAGGDGFQRVEVRTTNPEFRVRARRGYVS
jgi:VWFA-related protein